MSDEEDQESLSVSLMLYAAWCLLVFVMFLISAWFAWSTDTVRSTRDNAAYVSGSNHK